MLTICTDSLAYGKWLLDSFSSELLAGLFADALRGAQNLVGRMKTIEKTRRKVAKRLKTIGF